MKAVLLIDFGSTYTKITAVDVDEEKILGTAQSYTTIETDIINGLNNALAILKEKSGTSSLRNSTPAPLLPAACGWLPSVWFPS